MIPIAKVQAAVSRDKISEPFLLLADEVIE
jgi:hypothetical protein